MAFRSDLDALVLGILQKGKMHGYEITKRINAQGETVIRVKEGQLYPILHRLENEGKIQAQWVPQKGKPARKVYSLSEKGQLELTEQRQTWQQFVNSVNSILVPSNVEANHG